MTNVISKDAVDIPPLSETVQDYLSLIYVMERDHEPVIGAHLADLMGVKPPTVTNTLKRMVRDGLITMDQNGTHLTEEGWAASKVVMSSPHVDGMDDGEYPAWSKLHAEAHHLENAISPLRPKRH
jgi:DtxR family Mn-dependent transcriptional regulator